jgi:putative zinc finger/helix-turn-helix YgiT family protein
MFVPQECPVCGGQAIQVVEPREVKLGRWSAIVDDTFMRCGACGETYYLPDQMHATQMRAAQIIRERHGLFAPDRIRALRAKYGLTQLQLERLMGVGPKTVARWEGGGVVPSAAAHRLLRVLEGVPAAVFDLARSEGVVLCGTYMIGLGGSDTGVYGSVLYGDSLRVHPSSRMPTEVAVPQWKEQASWAGCAAPACEAVA